jgi:hypothetical protein
MSHKDAMQECCEMGMEPLAIETLEEFQCMVKASLTSGNFALALTLKN